MKRKGLWKRLVVTGLVSLTILSVVGCGKGTAVAEPVVAEVNTENTVVEDVEEQVVAEVEPSEESEVEETTEETVVAEPQITHDWGRVTRDELKIHVDLDERVSDEYMLNDYCSFKNVCDWLNCASPEYPTETFRDVISGYFGKESYFADMMETGTNDQILYELARLASISWVLNSTDGKLSSVDVYLEDTDTYIFWVSAQNSEGLHFIFNARDNRLKLVEGEESVDYSEALSDETLAAYMTAINQALEGNEIDVYEESSTTNTDTTFEEDTNKSGGFIE